MGVLKKTIGISSKKSLKVFRQGEALVVWSKAEPWTPEKKLGEVTSPGPWPHIVENTTTNLVSQRSTGSETRRKDGGNASVS